jgi:hyaluronoglucosaminidase
MRRLSGSVLFSLALGAVAAVGLAGPAAAQDYPPGGCSLGTSASVIAPGGKLTVTGSGFNPGPVTITFDGAQVAKTTADANGAFSVSFQVNASSGTHTIRAIPADAKCDPSATITISSAASRSGALAFTGSNSTFPFAGAGVALVLVGSVLTVSMRRRRTAQALKV